MRGLEHLRAAAGRALAKAEAAHAKAATAEAAAVDDAAQAHLSPGDDYWEARFAAQERLRMARRVAEALAEG